MAQVTTKSNYPNSSPRKYRQRLGKQEQRIVEIAEDYSPTTSTDWTEGVGAASAPSTQDGALDALAAASSGAAMKFVKAEYDFSDDGGAISSIGLGVTIPDNAVIAYVLQDIVTALAGAGTLQLNVPVNGTLAATLDNTDSGQVVGTPNWTTGFVKTTAARELTVDIAGAVLTGGKVEFLVAYMLSE